MNWPEGVLGRALAAAYLIAFPVTCAGIIWILVGQFNGDESTGLPASILFVAGLLTITGLSVALRGRVPERTNRLTKNMAGDQRAYHRLALGLDLRGAWRVVRGERAGSGGPN